MSAYFEPINRTSSPEALVMAAALRRGCAAAGPTALHECLSSDAFDMVLSLLNCKPDLFQAMRVCRLWRDAAGANYKRRERYVPALPDALLAAVAGASPGETLRLSAGVHHLSRELTIDLPLRLVGPVVLGTSSDLGADAGAVLVSDSSPVLLRTRQPVKLEHLTICRLGDVLGNQLAACLVESSQLALDSVRITCAAQGVDVDTAMRSFAPSPPRGPPIESLDKPQSGLRVGKQASALLRRTTISCTTGPAIKVDRGTVDAEMCTIAHSRRGANVVANGGRCRLAKCDIHGARGEGISVWNEVTLSVEDCKIWHNDGSGVAINSSGASGAKVDIRSSEFTDNGRSGVAVNSSVPKVNLQGNNIFSRNGLGDVFGARCAEHSRDGRVLSRMMRVPQLLGAA